MSPEDDIVRKPLFDVLVEIVDSARQILRRKESSWASLEAVSSWQSLEDDERILLTSIQYRRSLWWPNLWCRHKYWGRVAVEEHRGRCEAVAGGGQVARVARGQGVVGCKVGPDWNRTYKLELAFICQYEFCEWNSGWKPNWSYVCLVIINLLEITLLYITKFDVFHCWLIHSYFHDSDFFWGISVMCLCVCVSAVWWVHVATHSSLPTWWVCRIRPVPHVTSHHPARHHA